MDQEMKSAISIWVVLSSLGEFLAALGALVAAFYAYKSSAISERIAKESQKNSKVAYNPLIKVSVDPDDIGPKKFWIILDNVGNGMAREIEIQVVAQNRRIEVTPPSLEKDGKSNPIKIVENGTAFYENPILKIEYKNVFEELITTTATLGWDKAHGEPQVTRRVDWKVDF